LLVRGPGVAVAAICGPTDGVRGGVIEVPLFDPATGVTTVSLTGAGSVGLDAVKAGG
jgi:hypothetical protein